MANSLPPPSFLVEALRQLGPHDHLCAIYDTPQEQRAAAVPFLAIGIERNEKCVYIAENEGLADTREAMRAYGVDVDKVEKSGQLAFTTKEETYFKQGHFDPDWTFTFWREAAGQARARGFSALRGAGETEWILRGGPGLERWTEYESLLTDMVAEVNFLALCQYNRRRFSPEVILDLIRTHPIVLYRGTVCRNFYYVPPHELLNPGQPTREVERLLRNILEREQMDFAVREQRRALQQANDQLEVRVRERTQQIQQLNRELEKRVAELSAMNEELEAFTYSVSHDLHAPLHHINGFSQLLMEELGADIDPDAAHYLKRIREGTLRMEQLVDGLLQLSRTGRHQVRMRETDLNELLREAVAELEDEKVGREIQWRIGQLPVVTCDPVLMRQAFVNLLSNAIKFTRPRRPAVIEVTSQRRDGQHVVAFRDNGVGFSIRRSGKLFGVFQRFHHEEEFQGLGLGLAAVQRIIRKHSGKIWAEAEPEKGATIYFALPDTEVVPAPGEDALEVQS